MIKQAILVLTGSLFLTSGWTAEAEGRSKQELIGLGSGVALGAAAGPFGVVVGAALGSWLGDKFHAERSARIASEQGRDEAQREARTLSALLRSSESQADRLEAELRQQSANHRQTLEQAFDIQVFFRTAQSALEGDMEPRLARLGELIAPMDDIFVHLEGHADARGDATYNEQLSAERAAAVRDVLIRAGVPAGRILVSAEGESRSVAEEAHPDALALERRVRLTLTSDARERQAASQ